MTSEGGVTPKMELEPGALNTKMMSREKMMSSENVGSKNVIFRADKIDLKNLDMLLEKHLNKVFTKSIEVIKRPKAAWEIDLAKLDVQYSVARGGYATVYRGTYDDQDVAVKVLDWGQDGVASAAEIASLRASFWQEVTMWHKLDHPNVTKFIGATMGTSNIKIPLPSCAQQSIPSKACCVITEFVPGGTLKQYLAKNRRTRLPYKVVIRLALDISRGLSYLHSKKIVHRDIKTDNILLDANQKLKIADFGVSRVEAVLQRDMSGETGTYGYMAPEVLMAKPYNRKCDVYSFGICLWEIYSCNTPYSKLSLATVSCSVLNQHLRPDIPRSCPSALANIMRKCWDPKPDKRPEMHEVVKMLEAIDTSKAAESSTSSYLCFLPCHRP